KTGRLEFRLVDDDADIFATVDERAAADEDVAISSISTPAGIDASGMKRSIMARYARTKILPTDVDASGKPSAAKCRDRFEKWLAAHVTAPEDHEIGFEAMESPPDPTSGAAEQDGWYTRYLWRRPEIASARIKDAKAGLDPSSSMYEVNLTLDATGAAQFAEST